MKRVLLVLYFWAISSAAHALTFSEESRVDGRRIVVVSGEFSKTDNIQDFVSAVERFQAAAVTFDSPGGSVASAMIHGRMIRSLQLDTIQPRRRQCDSACALAFVGGVRRVADPGALGVHQQSFEAGTQLGDAVSATQYVTAELIRFITEMGVDAGVLGIALQYGPEDMRHLSAVEMAALRITTSQPEQANLTIQPSPTLPHPTREKEEAATAFVRDIINAHSGDATSALDKVVRHYAGQILYYGRVRQLNYVIDDKRKYFGRWPNRWYFIAPDDISADCHHETCTVTGLFSWKIESPDRNAWGRASFRYGLRDYFGFQVVEESGDVIENHQSKRKGVVSTSDGKRPQP